MTFFYFYLMNFGTPENVNSIGNDGHMHACIYYGACTLNPYQLNLWTHGNLDINVDWIFIFV